jgi:hypothetical protein
MRWKVMVPTAAMLIGLSAQSFADPVVVSCGPGQRTVVRSSYGRGENVTRIACVNGGGYQSSYRTPYATRYRVDRRNRSWGKTALTIAGGAGTGAGLGGIVSGKKGALIGGALGGGAASIYEGARRR